MTTVQTVTLLLKDGESKRMQIPNSLLQELVTTLGERSEWVHTANGSYEVIGVVVGAVQPKLIMS